MMHLTQLRSLFRFPGHQEHPGNANGAARRAGPDRGASFSAAAISCGAIMLSRTTGTCASCHRRHARHLDEQQPGHRPAAPAHPGEALTTDPADAGQHPQHPLPPTRASLQQRVTTPGMPRTDSTRRTPNPCGRQSSMARQAPHAERPVLRSRQSSSPGTTRARAPRACHDRVPVRSRPPRLQLCCHWPQAQLHSERIAPRRRQMKTAARISSSGRLHQSVISSKTLSGEEL